MRRMKQKINRINLIKNQLLFVLLLRLKELSYLPKPLPKRTIILHVIYNVLFSYSNKNNQL